ncbi:MAG: hypothetical protein JOY82_24970 [Streptosporangiaceae bacterium]|nr:hypothetical protein [Streptosporangiaceae bacterium]
MTGAAAGVPGVACPPRFTSQTRPLVNWHATDTPPPSAPGLGVPRSGTDPNPAAGVRAAGEAGACAGRMPDIAGSRGGGTNMSVLAPLARITA